MDTPQTTEEWAAAQVAADTPTPAPKGIPEDAINAKMAFGLDRAQAIAVLTAQAECDAAQAKPTKTKSK